MNNIKTATLPSALSLMLMLKTLSLLKRVRVSGLSAPPWRLSRTRKQPFCPTAIWEVLKSANNSSQITFSDHLFSSFPIHRFVPGLPRHLKKMNFKIETFREKIPSGPQGRKAGVHLRADYVVTSIEEVRLASSSPSLRWFSKLSPQMTSLLLFPLKSCLPLIPSRNCSQEEVLATRGRGTSFQTSRLHNCCQICFQI